MALTDELITFRCDSCPNEYTGKPHELAGLGWVRHLYVRPGKRNKGEFLCCADCEKHYAPIWAKKAA